ncbi:hypothetical protein JZO70_08940 [Enterococcus sp. 669A]|uniref:Esterase n=1 Tax=Candidatus Enterococcus moelleringii TaxID=2815325 RepID=A0ABS3L9F8_9ENTE|nr:alpha/beta hydrolase-fold protein [Enterococcus sp. 669A]MBO1306284.1 hypothetical protein [Enterococcus sp. 669A]
MYANYFFYSTTLGRDVSQDIFIPENVEDLEQKNIVYLLHDSGKIYSQIARDYQLDNLLSQAVVVIPEGGSSFFLDLKYDKKYESFLSDELPKQLESAFLPLGLKDYTVHLVGIGSGGFGALNLMFNPKLTITSTTSIFGKHDLEANLKTYPKLRNGLIEKPDLLEKMTDRQTAASVSLFSDEENKYDQHLTEQLVQNKVSATIHTEYQNTTQDINRILKQLQF